MPNNFFKQNLKNKDKIIHDCIKKELKRQQNQIELIASEIVEVFDENRSDINTNISPI